MLWNIKLYWVIKTFLFFNIVKQGKRKSIFYLWVGLVCITLLKDKIFFWVIFKSKYRNRRILDWTGWFIWLCWCSKKSWGKTGGKEINNQNEEMWQYHLSFEFWDPESANAKFTWSNLGMPSRSYELDRFLFTNEWLDQFPHVKQFAVW